MQKVVLATGNAGKVRELASLLNDFGLDVVAQTDLGVDSAEETGLTFIENAILKARHAAQITGLPAIADDSGLAVDFLGGAPGIYSARFAGEHGNDAANNEKLLNKLKPLRQDGAAIEGMFVCVLALVEHADDPLPQIFQGIWKGEILAEARGENGFGYDPLFWLPELGVSSAEMSKAEKNKISHRGQAMQLFKASLQA